jgi:hypothetical protein
MDPQVISGVVSLVTGYMTYRVDMQQPEQQPKPDEEALQKGEQAIGQDLRFQYGDQSGHDHRYLHFQRPRRGKIGEEDKCRV